MINKRGQFFILAAVILAVIIIGVGVVYNTVSVPESSRKFFSYSSQLDQETGAVVDYSFYTGTSQVANFVNSSIGAVLSSYPGLDVFACYTTTSKKNLTCDNYGYYKIKIYLKDSIVSLGPGTTIVQTGLGEAETESVYRSPNSTFFNLGSTKDLVVESGNTNYTIDLEKAEASSNQYYFVFRANTSGNLLASQEGS